MKLAIMQPYLFPYIGYFQLINCVDRFVVYDDVQFIKGGWANRNYVSVQDRPYLFSLPLKGATPNQLIRDTTIDEQQYSRWVARFRKTLTQAYAKSPNLDDTVSCIDRVFEDKPDRLADLSRKAIEHVATYLKIETEIVHSSTKYDNAILSGVDRVLDICIRENADTYVNAAGGRALYSYDTFANANVILCFLEPQNRQPHSFQFSILDSMMRYHPDALRRMLEQCNADATAPQKCA